MQEHLESYYNLMLREMDPYYLTTVRLRLQLKDILLAILHQMMDGI